jgi:hypothetical protein
LYNECNATDAEEAVIQVESWKGWASLNFIGSAGISVPTGMFDGSPIEERLTNQHSFYQQPLHVGVRG